ncbi:XRE family transcriptional regulator [Lysinibacillus halotolerans]
MKDANDLKSILSKNLKKYLDKKGITQTIMARDLNIPETTVSNWMKAETYPRPDKIQLMADYFKISRSDLTEDKSNFSNNVIDFPFSTSNYLLVGPVSAGFPMLIEAITEDELYYKNLETIMLPDEILGKYAGDEDIVIARANGDSMNEIFPHNSLLAIKRNYPISEIKNGDIVVFRVGGDFTVKLFYQDEERLIFRPKSSNPKFTEYVIDKSNYGEDNEIVGKVVTYIVNTD